MDTNKIFIDMAQRAHEFAEMCNRVANESNAVKEDPEAWRERNRQRQAAGVKFEWRNEGIWRRGYKGSIFTFDIGGEEDYREVPQEDLNLKPTGDRWYEMQIEQPEIGVISSFNKWDRVLTEKEISDLFSGKVRPEDIPQEASNVKETGVGIPEAARNILIAWQRSGLKFLEAGEPVNFPLKFDCTMKGNYTIPEQPIPEGMSVETVEAMWRQGLKLSFSCPVSKWVNVRDYFNWSGGIVGFKGTELLKHLRIPDQPIPERLLESVIPSDPNVVAEILNKRYGPATNPPPPHAAERALWKAQREAGTNEVWQKRPKIGGIDWADIRHDLMFEPGWDPDWDYRVKPMKLTAKIRRYLNPKIIHKVHDWEFTGTREEYRAECKKYGYAILSEIKEVVEKPKTVKYYFAMLNRYRCTPFGRAASDKDQIIEYAKTHRYIIIGDIEEREIEA